MKKHSNTSHIPDILFLTAKGFYDVGIQTAVALTNATDNTGVERLGVAAVNLTFAAELLLKGLHLITSKEPVRGHGLLDLFKKLPLVLRDKIELGFKTQKQTNAEDKQLTAMSYHVYRGDKKEPPVVECATLESFLIVHDKGFEQWRYLHELPEEGVFLEVDFKDLNSFIFAVNDVIIDSRPKQRLFLSKV